MYTYKDFEDKVKEYGFTPDQISEADYRLAQQNADAGVALLGYKHDWLTATNDSAKAMAHAAAEDIRSRYGNYSGGGDGGKFTPTGTAQYEDPWEQTIQSTVRNLQNKKFEWSPETDPTVKYYEDAYRREGERAMKDTLGAVAATTGGIPSSYATAAAAQQRNYYAQQMADKYPDLYQQAFDRFMQEYDREYNMLSAYGDLSELGYGRWSDKQERDRNARLDMADAEQRAFENQYMLDELGLKERAQDHTESIDWAQIGLQTDELTQTFDLEYAKLDQNDRQHMDRLIYDYKVFDASNEQFWAELAQDKEISDANIRLAYDQLSEEAQQFLKTHALAVQKHEDEVRLTEAEIKLQYDKMDEEKRQHINNLAFDYYSLAMSVGQWSEENKLRARELGIEENKIKKTASVQEWENAMTAAEFGDFSYLKKLGVNTDSYEALWNAQVEGTLNPKEEEAVDVAEDDIVNAEAENIMRKPTYPSGYDLNAATIDALAADAPGYKAKADAEKAEQEQSNRDNYGEKYAKYLNGGTMSKDELKNLNDAVERWIGAYRSGGDLTEEALAAVERYNDENVMKELFDRYRAGGQMLAVEESMMKHFVEDAYNRRRAGQKVTPIEQGILDIWLDGRNVKVGKYW